MANANDKTLTLYHGTVHDELPGLLAGLELMPRVTDYGAHGPFFLAFERAPAIERGHLRANDAISSTKHPAALLTYSLNLDGLNVYDFGEPNGPKYEEWRKFTTDNWTTKELEPHPDYVQYDVIISYMSNSEPEGLEYFKAYDGSFVRQVGLCTEEALERCQLVRTEMIEFKGWKDYKPE